MEKGVKRVRQAVLLVSFIFVSICCVLMYEKYEQIEQAGKAIYRLKQMKQVEAKEPFLTNIF